MGIKHFFMWFKNHFSDYTYKLPKGKTLENIDVSIDNLMIDMNGIFHNSAQKIHEYGNFKTNPRLMKKKIQQTGIQQQLKLFKDVCNTIEHLYTIVKPNKRLILCVDGPAPLSKQNQQRQRRFRSAMESANGEGGFDSNCITPGTKFMDYLTKYIDWFIRKKISEDPLWQNIEVVFSNEKAPGEGEHKIINYIRYYGNKDESYCINGMDADLIMLALGTHMPNFYILRDETYDPTIDYFCIDIGNVHEELINIMRWKSPKFTFIPDSTVEDFIFLCFIVGNDFLPHIPSIEIIESGIELILEIYKEVCSEYGHITHNCLGRVQFIPRSLEIFLQTIGQHEKENLEQKLKKKASFFPDPIIDNCSTRTDQGKWCVDIDKYRKDYWNASFPSECCPKKICHEYLEGMQWVLSYYTRGVPNWRWHFTYHYAPPASILASHLSTFVFPQYKPTIPSTPYQQLLCVLPPKSAQLIPFPLCTLLTNTDSPLKEHCPDTFEIDFAGKRKEWEGIVLLPMVDFELVRKCYFELLHKVKQNELKCNTCGCSFIYKYIPELSYFFNSYYGNIEKCKTKMVILDL